MSTIARFDQWADDQLEKLRGNPIADTLFANASHLGDFSVIWHIIGVARGLTSAQRARQAIVLSAVLGAESLVVNQGVKRLFRRTRPTQAGDARFTVRQPSTSSFPSGHASSAAFAATLLSDDHPCLRPMFWLIAAIVSLSRPYVRAHHASDIAGGLVTGSVLARLARRVWPR